MIKELLPGGVASVEAFTDDAGETPFPGEERFVERAVPRRRSEFVTARRCARAALAQLGIPPAPIGRAERGAPQWPEGVAGSITHCEGYRAAAVCRTGDPLLSLGIDAEPHAPLPPSIVGMVVTAAEMPTFERLARHNSEIAWDRLIFSAKESVFKAWYPLTRREVDFQDCRIDIHPAAGTIMGTLLIDDAGRWPHLNEFSGHFTVARGLVLTAIAVPA